MKKTAIIPLIAAAAFITPAFASCGSDGPDAPDQGTQKTNVTATVSPESLQAGASKTTLDLTVTVNADWAVRCDAAWVSIPQSGGVKDTPRTLKVTVEANTTFDERTASIDIVSGGKTVKSVAVTQGYVYQANPSATSLTFGGQASETKLTVTANTSWSISSGADWMTASPATGQKGETEVTVKVGKNDSKDTRNAVLTLTYGTEKTEIAVAQLSDEITAPAGYRLVWNDEFNEGTSLGSDWTHEVQGAGWVNNELQNYVKEQHNGKRVTEIKDGFLNINCFKDTDGKIYSGRVYAKVNSGWEYGYFEARLKLPSGKGTWPAFWMMPVGNDWNTNPWPKCGEIDIMEEVGYHPNYVSSSLHTETYNHTKGTQKTHEMLCEGAEGEFHVYALEWTADAITTYVDGKVQLKATKSEMGSDHNSWPFHYAFYPIFNLAWGGSWGGAQGVNESALPVTMQVDYLRIFQKE